jgi:hypothetical protein
MCKPPDRVSRNPQPGRPGPLVDALNRRKVFRAVSPRLRAALGLSLRAPLGDPRLRRLRDTD